MIMVPTEFSWIVLFFAFITTIPVKTMGNSNLSKVSPSREKCQNVYNSNNFYAGPNKEFETFLHEVKKELRGIREDISNLKGNRTNVEVYKNCAELYKAGKRISGVYTIDPDDAGAFDVFCDQKTAGGGWTVFQKRLDGSVDFYLGWADYKRGFGNLNGEFWLGLDKIHRLTKERCRIHVDLEDINGNTAIHVDLEDINGNTAYAEYDFFGVASERSKYRLSLGSYSGTAGDSFSYHRGSAFSTKDQDNDQNGGSSCAKRCKGAWWYNSCLSSNLNGLYLHGSHSTSWEGVNWSKWKGHSYSAKRAEMKIKPVI
ncbi:ficolin-1-like isoform X2 [Stylophora pistillata]|uniref:ficolin-1-like isoform X2 n=1 Tax=Stylophora pistillata TaxID=50429 RepID=UPI000C03D37D|nr:ficolin-1-like isoform X2 [Stylophora pistillata]